jgi:hypothetical protein
MRVVIADGINETLRSEHIYVDDDFLSCDDLRVNTVSEEHTASIFSFENLKSQSICNASL